MNLVDLKQKVKSVFIACATPLIMISWFAILTFVLVPILFAFLAYQDVNPNYGDCLYLSLFCMIPIGLFFLITKYSGSALLKSYAKDTDNLRIQVSLGEGVNVIPFDVYMLINVLKVMNGDEDVNIFKIKFLVVNPEKRILGAINFSELCECCKLDIIKFFDILFKTFKKHGYDLSWKHLGSTEYQITIEKIKESTSENKEDILELKPENIVETKQEEQEDQKSGVDEHSDLSISPESETFAPVKLTKNYQQRRIFKNQKEALAAKDKVEGEMIEIRGEVCYFAKTVRKDGYRRWSVVKHFMTLNLEK